MGRWVGNGSRIQRGRWSTWEKCGALKAQQFSREFNHNNTLPSVFFPIEVNLKILRIEIDYWRLLKCKITGKQWDIRHEDDHCTQILAMTKNKLFCRYTQTNIKFTELFALNVLGVLGRVGMKYKAFELCSALTQSATNVLFLINWSRFKVWD